MNYHVSALLYTNPTRHGDDTDQSLKTLKTLECVLVFQLHVIRQRQDDANIFDGDLIVPTYTACSLRYFMEECYEICRCSLDIDSGHLLDIDIAEDVPEQLELEKTWFCRFCLNLVSNSMRALSSQLNGRSSKHGRIAVAASVSDAEFLRIAVTDDGPGVKSEMVSHLFEKWHSQGRGGGTGLGLWGMRQRVTAVGGACGYKPQQPGACFWFELPFRAVSPSLRL